MTWLAYSVKGSAWPDWSTMGGGLHDLASLQC